MELRDRLRRALATGEQSQAAPGRRQSPSSHLAKSIPGLQTKQNGRGPVYVVERSWPLGYRHGRLPLSGALELDKHALRRLAPAMSVDDLAGAAFVDVETTGLSGGTGTYVFLVGVGVFEGDAFTVKQFFLADLAGEAAMFGQIAELLEGRNAIVSFNGRRFDMPLIETRLTMNRLPSLPRHPHVDLLHPARRFYRRRLPSCRLGVLEENVLGLTREDDVPGWMVPSLYIDYVRTGRAGPLRGVFEHNALDILSLATLLAQLGRLAGGSGSMDAEDYLALGRWDEAEGRLSEAASAYGAALEAGGDAELRSIARPRLARLLRRFHRIDEAAGLWREEAETGGPLEARLEALIELAKLEEHRRRDYAAAEALTRRALGLLEEAALRGVLDIRAHLGRDAVAHRLGRVSRRAATHRARTDAGRRSPGVR